MAATGRRYSLEKMSELGEAIFAKDILSHVRRRNKSDFVAIDVETGAYEVDADELAVGDRLLARFPDAQIWVRRVGSRYSRHFGGRLSS